ncbi:PEP-CTERM sorting domain-containing protein [Paludibaculum fermentans]|uniref:PEP-CTERM sorting domain-containing protein n=1 Tax=Paludibaculum fermentans TaxID=1473598 RepID=A0A7S7SNX5_PALFE|nr:PEP-CTERM sorting domain-containing protein [Paludibaculum fermentans]QOY91388.1 PEP-CTERM sorting domain-containing protein [Paludibaculum fermentans]
MRRSIVGLVFSFLVGVPSYAVPVYYQYNLGALGAANADAGNQYDPSNPGAWTGIWGGNLFSKGNVNVAFNSASKTSDPALQSDSRLDSVPFSIATSGNQSWSARRAVIDQGLASDAPVSLQLDTNVNNAQVVFLMMNTTWGRNSPSVEIVLQFKNGPDVTYTLSGGTQIRDSNDSQVNTNLLLWPNSINTNLISNSTGGQTASVNDQTYDMSYQSKPFRDYRDVVGLFIDPAYAMDTLTGIIIRDIGQNSGSGYDPNASRAFVWGVTVAAGTSQIPEPSTFALLGAGLASLAYVRRRRG